jgi:hypothetical protein
MSKSYWEIGKSGNAWLDEAWFTVAVNGRSLLDSAVRIGEVYELKDFLIGTKRQFGPTYLEEDLAKLRGIYEQVEDGSASFVWAFPHIADVMSLILMHGRHYYHSYPQPKYVLQSSSCFNPSSQLRCYVSRSASPETKL